jgi:hypothetical protein
MAKLLQIIGKEVNSTEKELEEILSKDHLEALAIAHNYAKRPIKKIDAHSFVLGFLDMLSSGKNNLRILSLCIGLHIKDSIQKTSLEARFNQRTFGFLTSLLYQMLNIRLHNVIEKTPMDSETDGLLSQFNNVLLSDSTCQNLPRSLHQTFPSSHNTAGNLAATMRLQVIYNYTKRAFCYLDLGNFRQNDQSNSDNILNIAQEGDLVLRDLGYSVLSVFTKMSNKGIFYISRFMTHISVFDIATKQKMELLSFLKGKTAVDMMVEIGATERLKTRLVARKLPKPVADERIKQAKQERHSKVNHNQDYFELLKWEFFITNVPLKVLDSEQVSKVYKFRWFIEIVFKSWKSHFNFKNVLDNPEMSYYRTLITIVLMLIKITYSFMHLFGYIDKQVSKLYNKVISPIKFMDVINTIWNTIINLKSIEELDNLIPQFAAHATYEKRKAYKNIRIKLNN